jgi:D-alanyl-D-alanine carboxypeptidase (penicillin-binding protein 5/6)
MLRKILLSIFASFYLVNTNLAFASILDNKIVVDAKAAMLMEANTGGIILAQNENDKLAPASVTKIMTILLIYDKIADQILKWDDLVTVSDYAASMGGSQIFLEPMEQMSVRDLTKSIIIASGNDAAVAMAEHIGGSEEAFVAMMNERAVELGMKDTNFKNACGLPAPEHVTSAHDIAIMSRELITKYPQVFEFTKIWMDTIVHNTVKGSKEFGLSNTNKLLKSYNATTGLKTGSTDEALYCISATAEKDGMSLIAVILGSQTPQIRFSEAVKMFDFGFNNYVLEKGDEAGTKKGEVEVYKGSKDKVEIIVERQVKNLIKKGKSSNLESKIEVIDGIKAPFKSGFKVGEITYYFDGEEVGRSNLITAESVNKAGLFKNVSKTFKEWI